MVRKAPVVLHLPRIPFVPAPVARNTRAGRDVRVRDAGGGGGGWDGGGGGGAGSGENMSGGGGSSYISGLNQFMPIRNEQGSTSMNSSSNYTSVAQLPAGTDGPDYVSGVGIGGGPNGGAGGNGYVVIYY